MSENIFKEIYEKVISLFRQTESEDNTRDIAKNRLRVVLMQDRTNLTPELLERMRKELVELLSKYVEMDKEALELNFDQEGDQMALMLSIPVIRAKDEEEIEKALAEEKKDSEEEDEKDDEEGEETEDETSEDEESSKENKDSEEETPEEEIKEENPEEEAVEEMEENSESEEEPTEDKPEEESVKETPEKKEKKK
ncbi:cell division topological specificity factor MinE [bacterium]|nr:cell division topological specificity factor MinE [bacterium]